MEDQPVVVPGVGQGDEIVHALGRDVGIQLGNDLAAVLHFKSHDRICHLGSLTYYQNMRASRAMSYHSIQYPRFFSRMARSISRLASRLATASRLS